MADYKKVVEMLGENLASLLELAKKWLVEWKVDIKKLLHLLQNIRKDDLLGLIAGTHEIIESTEKFALLKDLGVINVLDGYIHSKCLKKFSINNHRKFFSCFDHNITDENFSKPTRVLKQGDKLHVKVFKQIVSGTTTSEERMNFLSKQKGVYTGVQGMCFVFEQKRSLLPRGYWYTSFDEKDHLFRTLSLPGDVGYMLPNLMIPLTGGFTLVNQSFQRGFGDNCAFFGFFDEVTTDI